jgi:uncharacterized protein (DUF1800 family)
MSKNGVPPLDRLDPVKSWEPWEPTAADPWDLKWAGHLYRRAGFGASLAELRQAVDRGLPATLDEIIKGRSDSASHQQTLTALGTQIARQDDLANLRAWWVYLILNTPHPLREKMTLFWHGHFATSVAKVQRTELMFEQNRTLRQHALGRFQPFLLSMSRDPAMLIWLDSNSNIKGRANENYARELMELFSLGVRNYTESDVREAARAFTGWHTDGDKFEFNDSFHDGGEKMVLGQKGKWDGADVIRIVLEQPAAARFLVRKLYRYFISESAAPTAHLLKPLVEIFRKSDYDIGALVATILRSRHFFSEYAYRQRVKPPVDFVVGTARSLVKTEVAELPPAVLVSHISAMGQPLFEPPSVKGWAGGRAWLNTATVLARHNYAQMAAGGAYTSAAESEARPGFPMPAPNAQGKVTAVEAEPLPSMDPAALVEREKAATGEQIIDVLVATLLQGDISPNARAKLAAFVVEGKPKENALHRRIRETAHAIMTMPEYQLA